MSTEEKIIKNKVGLLKLSEMLGSVSEACKVMGYSRDSFALGEVLLWQDPHADLLGFGFSGAGEDARLPLDSSAGAGAEPCAAERRRRRGCGCSCMI